MAINRASIAKELLPGLNAVFGMEYGEVNNEHEPLYEIENSDRAFEEEVLFTGFGTAPTKGEGASVSYDDAQESYTARYTAETVALAFAVTEEAMEDNLYDTFAKLRARGLARAMANTKQVKAANIYNNGFTDTIGDGAAFFSASHPTISDGLQSNLLGAADLSEATLETALTAIQKIKDDRGILIGASAVSLHIPVDYWAVADRVLSSPGNTQTSAADANPTRTPSMQPVTWGWFLKVTTLTVALLTRMHGLLKRTYRTARRCLCGRRFRPRWSRTSILAIFDSKHGSVTASVCRIGVAGLVVLVNQQMREGGFGHSLFILKGEINGYEY